MTEEGDIKRRILDALEAVGALAVRVQSGLVKVRGGWMHLAQAGTPDIYVLVPPTGLSLWLEVKTATGEEREAQLAWADTARRAGAVVRTVRTPAEAVAAYLDAKAIPGASSLQQTGISAKRLERP